MGTTGMAHKKVVGRDTGMDLNMRQLSTHPPAVLVAMSGSSQGGDRSTSRRSSRSASSMKPVGVVPSGGKGRAGEGCAHVLG